MHVSIKASMKFVWVLNSEFIFELINFYVTEDLLGEMKLTVYYSLRSEMKLTVYYSLRRQIYE